MADENQEDLIEDFNKSILQSSNATDLVFEYGEVALDTMLSDGIIKEIPIFGTALKLYKAGEELKAFFFTKKILSFLAETEKVSTEERVAFMKNKDVSDIGECTLMLLDRIDSINSARLLGKAFCMYMRNEIDRNTFDIYSHTIKNLNSYLVRTMAEFYKPNSEKDIQSPASIQLATLGLIEASQYLKPTRKGKKLTERVYEETDFGESFYRDFIARGDNEANE